MKLSYSELTKKIKEAIRAKAVEIPRFAEKKEGCIRITSYPECQEAYTWMGGIGEFDPNDVPDVEDTYVILPGGTRVAKFKNPDGSEDIVDTYAITAMKIAQLSYSQGQGLRNAIISGNRVDERLTIENGFAPRRGALCCEITYDERVIGCNFGYDAIPPFCQIYVSVSGASQNEDLACAAAAIEVIRDFFAKQEYKFCVFAPEID